MSVQDVKSYLKAQIQMLKNGGISTNAETNIKQKGMLYAYEDALEKLNQVNA